VSDELDHDRALERDPFADLPLLGELRERLEARFLAAAHLPAGRLVRAAERPARTGRRSTRGGWNGRRSRALLVLGALLLVGGTATAAVTLSGTRSAPLSGSVPGRPVASGREFREFNFTEAGKRYRIVFVPQISGGEAGWRSFLSFGPRADPEGGEGGESGYPTRSTPLAGGAGVGFTSSPLPSGDAVDYVLTAPRVAAVRVGSRTIKTRGGSALPGEDRAAVFFVSAGSPPIAIPPAGAHTPYYIRVPARLRSVERAAVPDRHDRYVRERPLRTLHERSANHYFRELATHIGRGTADTNGRVLIVHAPPIRTVLVRATPLIALERDGREIAYTPPHPEKLARRIAAWQVPRPGERHPRASATHPLPGACEIAARGLPGLQPQWGHVLAAIEPVASAEGELFLSCVDTEYFLHGWPLDTAILLDAHRPGQTLGPIPGASPVAGHAGVVNVVLGSLPGDLTARRVGNAWLVVEGGASLAQRLQVLGALRIAKLALP
jgi:hypothetical protein